MTTIDKKKHSYKKHATIEDSTNNSNVTLAQGLKFKKYQNKITKGSTTGLVKKRTEIEGFISKDPTTWTKQQSDDELAQLVTLETRYNSVLLSYNTLHDQIINQTQSILERTNPSTNSYLNNNVTLTNNAVGYVTNMGVYKWYPGMDILNNTAGKNGCPAGSGTSVSGNPTNFNTVGERLGTTPALLVGTPMNSGKSCGSEGKNVYVSNTLNSSNVAASYQGCYKDGGPNNTPAMTIEPTSGYTGYTFETCKQAALDKGAAYFGLQSFNVATGTGQCSTSNDINVSKKYGVSENTVVTAIWSSGTNNGQLNTAQLTNEGELVVYSPSGQKLYGTGNVPASCVKGGTIQNVNATWGANCNGRSGWSVQQGNATNSVNSWLSGTHGTGSTGSVLLYQGCWYTDAVKIMGPGSYDTNSMGIGNKTLSSLIVQRGLQITIYEGSGFTGKSLTFNEGIYPCLVSNGFNDKTSSYIIRAINTSTSSANYTSNSYVIGNGMPDVAYGCPKAFDISYKCGDTVKTGHVEGEAGGQNYLLDCTAQVNSCTFTLNLQTDGNMCIYKSGSSTSIWCTGSNGTYQPNPAWVSSRGKLGQPYMLSGQGLNNGEWVSSSDGSILLIMQTDGNLVLYSSSKVSACNKAGDGNNYGGSWTNALYSLSQVGNASLIGKVGYVDENSVLKEYPASMITQSSTYTKYANTNSSVHDIIPNGSVASGSSITAAKAACDGRPECRGFIYDNRNGANGYHLKGVGIFPKGPRSPMVGIDLYTRNPAILNSDNSCSKKISPIDSIRWSNYENNGTKMSTTTQCTSSGYINEKQDELADILTELNDISRQMVEKINALESANVDMSGSITRNKANLIQNVSDYKSSNVKFNEYRSKDIPNMNGILSNSELEIIQENYSYVFWSILAAAVIILTMNTVTRNNNNM